MGSTEDAGGTEVTLEQALQRAVELLRVEALDDADELLAAIRRAAPDHPDALHFQGVLRHAQGRDDEGIALIRASLEIAPAQGGAWNNLGNILVRAQRLDEAQQAYEASVVHAEPADEATDAFNNLAMLARKRKRWVEAEAASRRSIALRPSAGDAWYGLSLALMEQGRIHDGLIANSQAVALMPRDTQSRVQVVRALTLLGERDQAAQLYRDWLVEEPDNPIVQHLLAACEGRDVPARASDAYVASTFDAYAANFDASLEKLRYRAPQLVADALRDAIDHAPDGTLRIVDAGCGTGLCGALLRPWASRLAGCDLSVGMLRQARPRGSYDVLHQAELMYYLRTQPAAFDVVVSADTLCYFGDLGEALVAARTALAERGLLVFTLEASDAGQDVQLRPTGRYAHSERHVRERLTGAGFAAPRIDAVVPRMEGGLDVHGWLVSARL